MTVGELVKALLKQDQSLEALVVHEGKVFGLDDFTGPVTEDDGESYSEDDGFDPNGGPQPFVAINTNI